MSNVDFILVIINFLLGGYILYMNSYLKQKGKNLAQKEDIEKITQLVEQTKRGSGTLSEPF